MNGELNKMLGREFFIGFFLPSLFFLGGNWLLVRVYWELAAWPKLEGNQLIEGTALAGLVVWIFAIFLQALNRPLFRFAEGYWPKEFWFCFHGCQRKRFAAIHSKLQQLEAEQDDCDEKKIKFTQMDKLMKCWIRSVTSYPSRLDLILPTTFGNVVRAYEDYSRVMYGFESIQGWCRLQAFMSKPFREVLGRDRAQVDLWLNLWILALVFGTEAVAAAFFGKRLTPIWVALMAALLAFTAYAQACNSATQYGEQVKAAFDVYLPALAKTLGYKLSCDPKVNKRFWESFSEAIVYHYPPSLERMATPRMRRADDEPSKSKEDSADENPEDDGD